MEVGEDILTSLGAKQARPGQYPTLEGAVERLARDAGLPVPSLWVVNAEDPNAFAAGESPYVAGVAIHTGLIKILSPLELLAVLAHEIAHIRLGHLADRSARALMQRGAVRMSAGRAINTVGELLSWFHPLGGLAAAGAGRIIHQTGVSQVSTALDTNRQWESAADQYANSLGLGRHLASALLRLEQIPCQRSYAEWSRQLMFSARGQNWSDHPPTGQRIDAGLVSGGAIAFACPKCLHPVIGGWPCQCGASAPGALACPCGGAVGWWDRYCSTCGAPIAETPCHGCGRRDGGESGFCATCGFPRP